MIGAGDMGDGRRSVVVKVISSVFPSGDTRVPGSNCDGRDRAYQFALSEGIPSIGHKGFHIDVKSHP